MFMTPFTTDKLLKCERAITEGAGERAAGWAMLRGDKREPLVLGHKDLQIRLPQRKLFAQELAV